MTTTNGDLDLARSVLKELFGYDRFKSAQEEVVSAALRGEDVLAVLQTGYGKCQRRGSLVLMHDGSTRKVEDIRIGDLLMGPDSKPRRVLRTDSGRDQMVKVTPTKGDPFVVTTDHILTLVHTQTDEIVDVRVDVWQTWSGFRKHHYKLFRVSVEFPRCELPLDPYMLGVILGDGSLTVRTRVSVTKPDPEIAASCRALAAQRGLRVRTSIGKTSRCPTHHFVGQANRGRAVGGNVLLNILRDLGLLPIASADRFIPASFLTAHRDDRLDLLAGLLDTDGSLNGDAGYEFSSKSRRLADDVTFLARSLGFLVTQGRCGPGKAFHRVLISGDCSVIPCRIERKKAAARRQKKDVLRTGFTVEPAGVDDYFGFLLDGDHRYLMGDFTVTHNSVCFQIPAVMRPGCAIVISPLIALMKDQVDNANKRGIPASFVNSSLDVEETRDRLARFAAGEYRLFYVAPERLSSNLFRGSLERATINFIVVDEAHAHQEGSMIHTDRGDVPVEQLRPGDCVYGWDAAAQRVKLQPVVNVMRRPSSREERVCVCLANGARLWVTVGHPVYLESVDGFVPAGALREGDEVRYADLQALQGSIRGWEFGDSLASADVRDDSLLFVALSQRFPDVGDELPELLEAIASTFPEDLLLASVWVCTEGRWFVAAHARGQSNAIAALTATHVHELEAQGRPFSAWRSWWERASNAKTASAGCRVVSRATDGALCLRWEKTGREEVVRARGPGLPSPEEDRRGGRTFAHVGASEAPGQRSGCPVSTTRVVRIARDEPGRSDATDRDTKSDSGLPLFAYHVAVAGTHTYFADGVFQHNCASVWGHDFRPAFSRIHEISSMLWRDGTRPSIIAVTATATADIEDDIAAAVGMSDEYIRIVGDPIRPNLSYEVARPRGSEWTEIMRVAHANFGRPGRHLVYTTSRGGAEKVAQMLCEDFGKNHALVYHGGMERNDRVAVQDAFTSGSCRIVCATNAFGMGIDVPDIRTVVHFGVPGSIEAYVQESGRAGRDGQPSSVILVTSPYAENLQRQFIDDNNPPIENYKRFWAWLLHATEGDVTLRKSAASIASEMNDPGVSSAQIATILNVLEAHGLVVREYFTGGSPLRVDVPALTEFRGKKKSIRAVARYVLERAKAIYTSGQFVEFGVDRVEASAVLGIPPSSFGRAITALTEEGVVRMGRTFTGKTTFVRDREAVLTEALPVDRLSAKRVRDVTRFRALLGYSLLPDETSRKQAIRAYFLSGGEAQRHAQE